MLYEGMYEEGFGQSLHFTDAGDMSERQCVSITEL